jgi:tetratricopeptide (TPR) repeat protein
MAKQRPPSRPRAQSGPTARTERTESATGSSAWAEPARNVRQHPRQTPAVAAPQRRTTYIEAVALYEQGLDALQHHDYSTAAARFESVLAQYPEEKELHERVRLYLNVCRRHATTLTTDPQTVEERLFAATLAINGGKYDEALNLLRLVRDEDPDNDHALYMLAVAHAQRGEHAEAIAHLERAIAINPENRALARRDADLETLREDESFRTTLDAAAPPARVDRRRPTRTKSAR